MFAVLREKAGKAEIAVQPGPQTVNDVLTAVEAGCGRRARLGAVVAAAASERQERRNRQGQQGAGDR
ncbi:MAG: hypothetical protein M0042_06055, partial [Nitrospiraceae bacterium]|nr:hypothetical protein [Nitrospiraceae bacterium]